MLVPVLEPGGVHQAPDHVQTRQVEELIESDFGVARGDQLSQMFANLHGLSLEYDIIFSHILSTRARAGALELELEH